MIARPHAWRSCLCSGLLRADGQRLSSPVVRTRHWLNVARLRTLKTDQNPLILKCNMDAGHGGASGRYEALREKAYELAFILTQLGVTK